MSGTCLIHGSFGGSFCSVCVTGGNIPMQQTSGIATALPRTDLSLHDARQKLAGWHFGMESLTADERAILYVAEALLRELDRLVTA